MALARVLTSIENLAILEEKEKKKKALAEEKEQRKRDREEKKKKREEENKKKAEEKAKKIAERAKKAAEKANQRTQRVTKRKRSAESVPLITKKRKTSTVTTETNENECCVCFGTYEKDVEEGNGREWLNCTCGRWLHDDCVSNVVDLEEDATICPVCRPTDNA